MSKGASGFFNGQLKAKAVEEALKFYWEPDPAKAVEELGDLLEVIESAARSYGYSFDEVKSVAQRKREERGGFEQGVVLLETREVPLIRPEERRLFRENDSPMSVSRSLSRADSLKERLPSQKGEKGVAIPLIPPEPSVLARDIVVPLKEGGEEVAVRYTQKHVTVTVRPSIARDDRQLSLFKLPSQRRSK